MAKNITPHETIPAREAPGEYSLECLFSEIRTLCSLMRDVHSSLGERTTGPIDQPNLDSFSAAKYLGISPRKLDQLVSARMIRPLRIGRKRLFPRKQLDAFLRAREVGR